MNTFNKRNIIANPFFVIYNTVLYYAFQANIGINHVYVYTYVYICFISQI